MSRALRLRHLPVPLGIAVAGGILLLAGTYALEPFGRDLLTRAFIFALLAISLDLIWGYAGILSFGQAAFFGIGGYSLGITAVHISDAWWAWPGALAVGVILGAAAASLVGWLAFYVRATLPALYVAVLTLAFGEVLRQLVISGGSLTGGTGGLAGFPIPPLHSDYWYLITGGLVIVTGLLLYRVVSSDAGSLLVAIRENETRGQYLGLPTPRLKLVAFAVSGGLAALAGYLYAGYTAALSPPLLDFSLATDVVVWTAVGGRGTLVGPIVGATGLVVLGSTLSSEFPLIWPLFLGALFVAVVMFMPRGLLPTAVSGAARVGRTLAKARARGAQRRPRAAKPATAPDVRVRAAGGGATRARSAQTGVPALDVAGVGRRFGTFQALSGVSFEAREGEIVAIVGPNGAGKSTLIECISDGRARTTGCVRIGQHTLDREPPYRLVAAGVGRKFQAANVFESLTVADSLRVAASRGHVPSVWRRSQTLELPRAAVRVARSTGLLERLTDEVRDLDHGLKQALELSMVLALEPRVLLLDEPTAGLSGEERSAVARVISDLAAVERICIILVEHDFAFVKEISTRMIVLHEGSILLDGTVEEVSRSSVVHQIYLGRGAEATA